MSGPTKTRPPYQRKTPLSSPSVFSSARVGPAEPIAILTGPLVFPLHGVVDIYHRWVWDTNSYYRDLGVAYDASRRQLMDAYIARSGSESVRLTFVLKQLLDPDVRARYDSTPPGSVFFDSTIAKAIYEAAPKVVVEEGERPDSSAENTASAIDSKDRIRLGSDAQWGFYLWGTHGDADVLRRWMMCLCRALSSSPVRVAVGSAAGPEDAFVYDHGSHRIAFLRVGVEPTDALASTLATALSI